VKKEDKLQDIRITPTAAVIGVIGLVVVVTGIIVSCFLWQSYDYLALKERENRMQMLFNQTVPGTHILPVLANELSKEGFRFAPPPQQRPNLTPAPEDTSKNKGEKSK